MIREHLSVEVLDFLRIRQSSKFKRKMKKFCNFVCEQGVKVSRFFHLENIFAEDVGAVADIECAAFFSNKFLCKSINFGCCSVQKLNVKSAQKREPMQECSFAHKSKNYYCNLCDFIYILAYLFMKRMIFERNL